MKITYRVARRLLGVVSTAVAVGFLATGAQAAPLGFSGGTYTQDFDTLPSTGSGTAAKTPTYIATSWTGTTGLVGWQMSNPTGSQATTEYRAQDGSGSGATGRGMNSYGTTGSSDRALGILTTSAAIPNFGLVLTNNSASTISQFTLSFTGEQWRRGDATTHDTMSFAYGTGLGIDISASLTANAALSFTSPNTLATPNNVALDGNLPENQVAKSATISGLTWAPGQNLVLRWVETEASGQDDGLAIDNLTFTAAIPEPSTWVLAAMGLVTVSLVGLRRWAKQSVYDMVG